MATDKQAILNKRFRFGSTFFSKRKSELQVAVARALVAEYAREQGLTDKTVIRGFAKQCVEKAAKLISLDESQEQLDTLALRFAWQQLTDGRPQPPAGPPVSPAAEGRAPVGQPAPPKTCTDPSGPPKCSQEAEKGFWPRVLHSGFLSSLFGKHSQT
jgi:hypothetical protein